LREYSTLVDGFKIEAVQTGTVCPRKDWILAEVLEEGEEKTDSGLVLVKTKEPATKRIKLVAFGPEANPVKDLVLGSVCVVEYKSGGNRFQLYAEDGSSTKYEFHKYFNLLGIEE